MSQVERSSPADTLYFEKYKELVLNISRQLNFKECLELFYAYRERANLSETARPSESDQACQLKLLDALEKARTFSHFEPKNLQNVLSTINRKDLISEIATFQANNAAEIECPTHLQTATHFQNDTVQIPQVHGQATDSSQEVQSVLEEKEPDSGYVKFIRKSASMESLSQHQLLVIPQKAYIPYSQSFNYKKKPHFGLETTPSNLPVNYLTSPTYSSSLSTTGSRSGTITSSDEQQESSPDTSDEHVYERLPGHGSILKIICSEPRPLVEENIRLLVRPIRTMIERDEQRAVSSERIPGGHHSVFNAFFQLKISIGSIFTVNKTVSYSKFISAELYLVSNAIFPDSCHLKAHLQIRLPSKRHKRLQLKSLHHGSKKQKSILGEQTVLLDLPAPHGCQATQTCEFDPFCVAIFPNLMSYKNFMDDKLVCVPYLNIKLCVSEH